jgi:hypothetical protein
MVRTPECDTTENAQGGIHIEGTHGLHDGLRRRVFGR